MPSSLPASTQHIVMARSSVLGPLTNFSDSEAGAFVKFIEVFNRVHQLKSELSGRQLRALQLRSDWWVTYILQVWKESQKLLLSALQLAASRPSLMPSRQFQRLDGVLRYHHPHLPMRDAVHMTRSDLIPRIFHAGQWDIRDDERFASDEGSPAAGNACQLRDGSSYSSCWSWKRREWD